MVPDTGPDIHDAPLRVLVAGGGVAGLEALLALSDMAADRVDVTLLSPQDDFVYRPLAVAEPFAMGRVHRYPLSQLTRDLRRALRPRCAGPCRRRPARWSPPSTASRSGSRRCSSRRAPRPRLAVEHALTWWPEGDPDAFGGLLRDLEQAYTRKVAFVVPPQVAWALPAYELALMTARQVKGMGIDDAELTIVTPEDAPLGIFGRQAADAVAADLAAANIDGRDRGLRATAARRAISRSSRVRGGSRSTVSWRSRARSAHTSPGFRPMTPASSRPTSTPASWASKACGRPATGRTSRSSRVAWPRSRPTRPPRASPRWPARASTRSRSARSCAGC